MVLNVLFVGWEQGALRDQEQTRLRGELEWARGAYARAEAAFCETVRHIPFDGAIQKRNAERLAAYNRYRNLLRRLETLSESERTQ